jgi:hypothetical protein
VEWTFPIPRLCFAWDNGGGTKTDWLTVLFLAAAIIFFGNSKLTFCFSIGVTWKASASLPAILLPLP